MIFVTFYSKNEIIKQYFLSEFIDSYEIMRVSTAGYRSPCSYEYDSSTEQLNVTFSYITIGYSETGLNPPIHINEFLKVVFDIKTGAIVSQEKYDDVLAQFYSDKEVNTETELELNFSLYDYAMLALIPLIIALYFIFIIRKKRVP